MSSSVSSKVAHGWWSRASSLAIFFFHHRLSTHWARKHVVGRTPVHSYVYKNVWRIRAVFRLVTAILCVSYNIYVTTEILDARRVTRIFRKSPSSRDTPFWPFAESGFFTALSHIVPFFSSSFFGRPFSRISQVMDATLRRRRINERSPAINH